MVITYNNKPLPEPFTVFIHGFNFSRYMEYANEDIDCELIDGVLVIHSPASLEHELIFKFILNVLDLYTQQKGLGTVVGSRFTMRLSDSWAPEPDVMFIEKGIASRLGETYLDGPATAVFEILSPSNRRDDLTKKIPGYIKMGVKEAWAIDAVEKQVTVFSKNKRIVASGDDWAISSAIDGFKIRVSWLWSVEKLSVLEKLGEISKPLPPSR
jgi:Uma2 family endonuclease